MVLFALAATAPAQAQDATRPCSFIVEGGSEVNVLYPDEAAAYWPANAPIPDGGHLEIHGQYPHARYMSFATYTTQLQSIDGLHDAQIAPDPGSDNPFVPGGNRKTDKREYTLRIVKGAPPAGGPAPNTLYTASPDGSKSGGAVSQRFSLRIYDPDLGLDRTGGVPLPDVTLVTADGRRTVLPRCPDVEPPATGLTALLAGAGSGQPSPIPVAVRGENPPVFRKFTGMARAVGGDAVPPEAGGGGGFADNPDNKYISATFSPSFGQVLELRAKAPTAPSTNRGQAVMGTGQLRYWSFCTNSSATSYFACRQDDQVALDNHGYYTIVVSTAAARPRNATLECGVTWLPTGPLTTSVMILRNMLPAPSFAQAIQRVEPGAEEAMMGDYYPRGKYYATTADFEREGCQ